MNTVDWQTHLDKESRRVIDDYDVAEFWVYPDFPDSVFETEWLGFPGQSDEQICRAEADLGIDFPPSYRSFLKCTNGWRGYAGIPSMLPIHEVNWFRTNHQDWIDAYTISIPSVQATNNEKAVDSEYISSSDIASFLPMTLQISVPSDGDVILLNPKVIVNEEWEAWYFGKTYSGGKRYSSFVDLFLDLIDMATQCSE